MQKVLTACAVIKCLILMTVSSAQAKSSKKKTLVFTSMPDNVEATVWIPASWDFLGTCTTPCELKIKTREQIQIMFQHDGFETSYFNLEDGTRQDKKTTFHGILRSALPEAEDPIMKEIRENCERLKKHDGTDREAAKCIALPPVMPELDYSVYDYERSGFCELVFDVSKDGTPNNIRIHNCSEKVFEAPSIKAVSEWTYVPKIQNGVEVETFNTKTTFKFLLKDERGRTLPPLAAGN